MGSKVFARRRLKDAVGFEGKGLHSGIPVKAVVGPGKDGFVFVVDGVRIEAVVENVVDTSRCTVLGKDGASVGVVEHVLSALVGAGVSDAEIVVEGGELPAMGGRSLGFYDGFLGVGLEEFGEIEVEGPFERVFFVDGKTRIAIATGEGYWRCVYELEGFAHGKDEVEFVVDSGDYGKEVGFARTIVLEHEIAMAKAAGLGKGLEEGDVLGIGKEGYLGAVLGEGEAVRHKLLDLMGDLALSGVPAGHLDVVGEWTGHRVNVEAARKLGDSVEVVRRLV